MVVKTQKGPASREADPFWSPLLSTLILSLETEHWPDIIAFRYMVAGPITADEDPSVF